MLDTLVCFAGITAAENDEEETLMLELATGEEVSNTSQQLLLLNHSDQACTERNFFVILLNLSEIRLYLPFSD